jgi:branched-chain amino acid aminotransferase
MYGKMVDSGVIWVDGKLTPWKEAGTHLLTHSLHYGTAIFEGVRAYATPKGPAIFRLHEHTKRLFDSAKIMDMPVPFSYDELIEAQKSVIKANKLASAYMRPLLYYGDDHLGISTSNLSSHVMIAAWEWGAYLGEDSIGNGIKVKTSSFTRHHINITLCKAKVAGNYVNSSLALKDAQMAGCHEALLLDPQGHVAEGSAENVFVIRDNIIYTPMLTSCLEGITRDTIMLLARELGYAVQEKLITRDEVYIADEAFFTGTAVEVTPIIELDARKIGEGKPGPITQKLQKAYFDIVSGKNDKYKNWLTYI